MLRRDSVKHVVSVMGEEKLASGGKLRRRRRGGGGQEHWKMGGG